MAVNTENKEDQRFALGKENLRLLLIGVLIIVVGFVLMVGGGSSDPNVFNKEIFGFQRIVLAPVIVMIGFVFEIFAIMKKPRSEK